MIKMQSWFKLLKTMHISYKNRVSKIVNDLEERKKMKCKNVQINYFR